LQLIPHFKDGEGQTNILGRTVYPLEQGLLAVACGVKLETTKVANKVRTRLPKYEYKSRVSGTVPRCFQITNKSNPTYADSKRIHTNQKFDVQQNISLAL
jgi:hypothetical protein